MGPVDLRRAADFRDRLLEKRLDTIVPALMEETGIDCWILVSREHADDAVLLTMLPSTWMSSRRRTIVAFFAGNGGERMAVSRYQIDGLFPAVWDPDTEPDQWQALARVVSERDPAMIAVNKSAAFPHADGLSASEHEALVAALGPMADRIVPGDDLAIGWLERRLPEERAVMAEACAVAHDLLRRALSAEAVRPGATTTTDLEWWLREQVHHLGAQAWFHPTASVQRRGGDRRRPGEEPRSTVIEPGDLLHVDFGIVWHGLCTDQQQHAYVLRHGEASAPEGLTSALAPANRLQDILMGKFQLGRTGNQVLAEALAQAGYEGIIGRVYAHPIGFHGHGAGPVIGLWDRQEDVPGQGDRKLSAPTAWSIELMVETAIPEWDGQTVEIMLEEDAWFDGEACQFLDGRQTELWLVG